MAEIVAGFGSSHTPLMSLTTGELWQEYAQNADPRNKELVKPPNGQHLSYEELLARANELSVDVEEGASMFVARAHPQSPTDEGWRGRVRAVAERGARAVVSRSIAAQSERDGVLGAEVLLLVPGGEESTAARAADGVLREMEATLTGFTFAIGRSRLAFSLRRQIHGRLNALGRRSLSRLGLDGGARQRQ